MNDETDQPEPAPDGGERKVRSRDQRLHGAAEALHSGVLDGRSPSPAAIRDAWDYIDGRRTLDEILDDVRRRHTRRPEEEP